MSQVTSAEVPSGSGLSVRQAINAVMAALMSNNSGSSEPPNPVPGMAWFDTNANDIKIRNAAGTAWLLLSDMIGALEYDRAQTLTPAQMLQALQNIGGAPAISSATVVAGVTEVWSNLRAPDGGRWFGIAVRQNESTFSLAQIWAGNTAGGTVLFAGVSGHRWAYFFIKETAYV